MVEKNIYSLTFVQAEKDDFILKHLGEMIAQIPNLNVEGAEVLSPGKALDIHVKCVSPDEIRTQIRKLMDKQNIPVDFCLQPVQNRQKSLLICDMDSTLIGQECIDELADFAGVKDKVAGITEQAMRGELDFEMALNARVALLDGLALDALETCYQERISLNPGAPTLSATMKALGAKTVIVSGGFTVFAQKVARDAGFEHFHANVLLEDGATLSGKVQKPILGRDAKLSTLNQYAKSVGGPQNAVAIGDGANDLAMITASGLGIAYRAKPIVARTAHCAINHTDLTSALYFQGIRESQFIRPV